jgi:hypothetical protein
MTAFLIATIVYFILSLGLGLIQLAINAGSKGGASSGAIVGSAINIVISLVFITWSIILLVS